MEQRGAVTAHPSVGSIWRRWSSRFTAVGVDASIVDRLRDRITVWDEWCDAWCAEGDELRDFGQVAAEKGHMRTAATSWVHASLLYLFGGMYFVHDQERFAAAHRRQVQVYGQAAQITSIPVRRLEAPFGGTTIPVLVQNPRGHERAPIALMFNGFEGSKEESQARVAELHERGIATASWDGPGRGETWESLPMTGDYGPPTEAVIDALSKLPDIQTDRVGAVGPNRGGFLALKAAAACSRITACAVVGPGFDRRGTRWDDPYQVLFDRHLFHVQDDETLRRRLNEPDLSLEGDVGKIRAAVMVIAGGRDRREHHDGSRELFERLTSAKEWVLVPESERNGSNASYKTRPLMADFIADQLA